MATQTSTHDTVRFIWAMVRSPATVGAVAPSSRYLAERMLDGIELQDGQNVLELGPGTGPITRAIEQRLTRPEAYLGIEREGAFVRLLESRFPQLRFVEGSAEHSHRHLREAGLEDVRAIISGLPFASLPMRVQSRLIVTLDRLLLPGVEFRTFQYVHAWMLPAAVQFRRRMTRRFGPPGVSRPVLRNLPPAVVLTWKRS